MKPRRDMTRSAVKTLSKAIIKAKVVFEAARAFKVASESWCRLAALHHTEREARDPAQTLVDIGELVDAGVAYVRSVNALRLLVPARIGEELEAAIGYVIRFTRDNERHPWGDAYPIGELLVGVSLLRAGDRCVQPMCLDDVAWSAAFSWVSFTEAIDSGRATELRGMADADICEARRLCSVDRAVKGGTKRPGERATRKVNADAVSANRRKLESAERDWLRRQPAWVIEGNESLAAVNAPGAISLRKRSKRERQDPK